LSTLASYGSLIAGGTRLGQLLSHFIFANSNLVSGSPAIPDLQVMFAPGSHRLS
jgi:hypothetical protein